MSLVVAQKHGDSIALVSDTQVSSQNNKKRSIFEGVIKCVVLTHSCTIAFAGEIEVAKVAFESVETMEKEKRNRDNIIDEILGQHVASNRSTDFLLAFMCPSELVCIKNGEARRNCLSAWIGEQAGFEVFQSALNAPLSVPASTAHVRLLANNPDLPDGLVSRMLNAMNVVAAEASLPTVGGLAIAAIGSGDMFRYAEHIVLDAPFRGNIDSGEIEIVSQGAATGQCTVFASFVLGKRGSLFPITYFLEANLLLLHPTRIGVAPFGIRAHSFDEALHILQEAKQLYCGTSLPRQDNYLRAMSQAFSSENARKSIRQDPRLKLTSDQWRRGGRRIPVEIKVVGGDIKFDDTRLSINEEKLVKNGDFLLVHSDGNQRYSTGDMFRRLVFEYQWLPEMSYDQRLQVTVLGPCDSFGRQLVKADVGGRLFELKRLMITANIHALPENELP
jgi:hypothetical protein